MANEHAGFALGVARRAIDEALDLAKHKARGSENPQLVAGRPVFQHEIGGLDIELLAARALVRELYGTAWSRVLAGEPVADEWQMRIRAAAVHATDVALAVTRAAFRHGGGQALRAGSMLDRCLRDTQAAAQHLFVDQAAYQLHGERLLRLPQGGAPA